MFSKSREALVQSFVGAIAVGWIFAQGVLDLVEAVSAPVGTWATLRYMARLPAAGTWGRTREFPWELVAMPLFRGVALIVIGYLLLRWLYYEKRVAAEPAIEATAEPENSASV